MAVTVTLENSELNPHEGRHPRLTVTGSMTAAEMKLNERGVRISGLPEPPPPSQPVTIRNLCGRDVRIFVRPKSWPSVQSTRNRRSRSG